MEIDFFMYCWRECKNWHIFPEHKLETYVKAWNNAITLLSNYSKWINKHEHKDSRTMMFAASVFLFCKKKKKGSVSFMEKF